MMGRWVGGKNLGGTAICGGPGSVEPSYAETSIVFCGPCEVQALKKSRENKRFFTAFATRQLVLGTLIQKAQKVQEKG